MQGEGKDTGTHLQLSSFVDTLVNQYFRPRQ